MASETGTGLDDLGCTTWVGAHPFDGRAVACWVTHPNHPEHADQAHLFAAAIQAPELRPDELIRELDPGVVTMRIDAEQGYATLTLWGQPVAEITCEQDWCDVAGERGWVLLVVTPHPPPPPGNGQVHDYLTGRVHLGVVTTA